VAIAGFEPMPLRAFFPARTPAKRGVEMRDVVAWMVEQICRPFDTKVCAISNLEDESDSGFPSYYLSA
jgi:hypothetical protein